MKTVLIKCGGSTIAELSDYFFHSLKELQEQGYRIVFVHGGGPQINWMLEKLNVQIQFENGLRKTTEETMKVVEMILAGQTNRQLVEQLSHHGLTAIGLQGSDAGLLQGDYINKEKLGLVGEIVHVNIEILTPFLEKNWIPVITPIAIGQDGKKLNVNADYAAAAVANALGCEHCLFVTDVEGIIIEGQLKREISFNTIDQYIESGHIYGGMIPKVKSALSVIQKGIKSVTIVSGRKKFYLHNEWFGTKILGKERVLL